MPTETVKDQSYAARLSRCACMSQSHTHMQMHSAVILHCKRRKDSFYFLYSFRFSTFFHQLNCKKIFYVYTRKISTSPAICCYITLWESKIQKCYWFWQHPQQTVDMFLRRIFLQINWWKNLKIGRDLPKLLTHNNTVYCTGCTNDDNIGTPRTVIWSTLCLEFNTKPGFWPSLDIVHKHLAKLWPSFKSVVFNSAAVGQQAQIDTRKDNRNKSSATA